MNTWPGATISVTRSSKLFTVPRRETTLTRSCGLRDRKSTRLNSSHGYTSYAVCCLKKKIINLFPRGRNMNVCRSHSGPFVATVILAVKTPALRFIAPGLSSDFAALLQHVTDQSIV